MNFEHFVKYDGSGQIGIILYLDKLTPAILNDMADAVYVHAPDKSSGHRVQEIEISYNYIGILPTGLLQSVQNEKRHDRSHAALNTTGYCLIGMHPMSPIFDLQSADGESL